MGHDPWTALRARAEAVREAIERRLGIASPGPLEEAPEGRGLFAIAAFAYAKELRRAPAEIASEAARTPVEAPFVGLTASGGYVNFAVEPAAFAALVLASVREMGDGYGRAPAKAPRILLEHTSANPTGPLHVGRARNPILGDSLGRLLAMAGYPVTREYLVNDVGK